MAQRSITSFFNKAPRRSKDSNEEGRVETAASSLVAKQREGVKREHSGSDSDTSPHPSRSPAAHRAFEKKSRKRLRIESSDSEPPSPPPSSPPPPPRFQSTECIKSERAKVDNLARNGKADTPARAGKADTPTRAAKPELSPLTEKDTNVKLPPASPPPARRRTLQPIALQEEDDLKKEREVLERVTGLEYTPGAAGYSPVADACWARGEPVPYLALARTLERIEATSARLRIVHTLSDYLRSVLLLTPADLLPSIYLCLNKLAPAYHSLELGVAETYLMKAIAQSTGRTLAQVKADAGRVGDLGLVAEQSRSTQRVMFRPAPLTVRHVFSALRDLAHLTGQSSMNKKIAKIQTLFVACRESEARYLIRSLAGKLRVGLAEQSVLQALAQAVTTTPPAQPFPPPVLDASRGVPADTFKARVEEQALIIKTTYCECPNYELLVPALLEHGVGGLPARCRLTPGVPLKPMLAHPTRGVHEVFQRFENVQFTCEWKYDGERAQIHVPEGAGAGAAIFSRNQENNTSKYPDVVGRLGAALRPSVSSCVLDCEAVAWDPVARQILPFQVLSTRKRKDAAAAEIKVQVCVFMFDLLYLNGRALVREPLAERRRLLHQHFNTVPGEWMMAESRDCGTLEEVQDFLEESVRGSCEGLMVKTLHGDHATYEIAKRSRNWLKLKKDYLEGVGDTVDAVVIGAYLGRGKRTGLYGGFLLACYDPDAEEFQSLCKIGTGFTDDDLQRHSRTLQQHRIPAPRSYYRYDVSHAPDVWLAPGAVWEVRCADLSLSPVHRAAIGLVDPDKGISLRFPRFVRERDDKSAEEATSARQIASVYLAQDQVKNQAAAGGAARAPDDDFY